MEGIVHAMLRSFSTPLYRTTGVTILIIGIAILLRLFLITASLQVPATSDEASVVLQAKEIARGHFPLLFLGQPLLFPVEAYTMAPLVEWLPRTTAGARYQTWVLGGLSVFGFLLLARTVFAKGERWPAYLLILFPSSYLLLLTAGYAPPQYPTSLTLAWFSVVLVLKHRQRSRPSLLLLTGFACGLAISNHLLFLPVAVAVLALIVFNGNCQRGLVESLPFAFGLCLGLTPLLAAKILIPGAYQFFTSAYPLSLKDTIDSLLHFVLSESLAGAMGMYPTLFPDLFSARLIWVKEIRLIFAVGYIVLCGYLLTHRLSALLHNLLERTWPKLQLVDAALFISLMTIAIFASHRNESLAFRYLLHAIWCFPFLIGYSHYISHGKIKKMIACIVGCCVVFNIVCSIKVVRQWRKPGRISQYSDLPPISPLVDYLQEKGISHCYATFWLAYRILFESDENIKCTGPFNERFLQWPIPYKQEVDDAEDTVYVLTVTSMAMTNALDFETDLSTQDMTYQKVLIGPFNIYGNFSDNTHSSVHSLDKECFSNCLNKLSGEEELPKEICHISEEKNFLPLVNIGFNKPQILTRLKLNVNPLLADFQNDLLVKVHREGMWRLLRKDLDYRFARLSFAHGHPIYHDNFHLLTFEKVTADALRLSLPSPPQQLLETPPTFEVFVSP